MDKEEGYIEFLGYESYKIQLDLWYKINNIIQEKVDLYYDFIISLIELIDNTYLGDDVLRNEQDIKNHFSWCFTEIISNFNKESIFFKTNGAHYDFLWIFFHEAYYQSNNENKMEIICEYFDLLFNKERMKSQIEMQQFIEFYKLLDQNLKK